MPDPDDRRFDRLLREALAADAATVTLTLAASALELRWDQRRHRRTRRRLVVVALAAALLIPMAALATGAAIRLADADPAPYDAILVRTPSDGTGALDVIAVRADGRERRLARLRPDGLGDGARLFPEALLAPNGQIAVQYGRWISPSITPRSEGGDDRRVALFDLRDPSSGGRDVPTRGLTEVRTSAWGPDGRFATLEGAGGGAGVTIVDPATGRVEHVPFGTDERVLRWTADGRGLVSAFSRRATQAPIPVFWGGGLFQVEWSVVPLLSGATPQPVEIFGQTLGPRTVVDRAATLQVCWPAGSCPDAPGGAVATRVDGTIAFPYRDQRSPGFVRDASFAADGRSIWVLLDTFIDGRTFRLIRAEPNGQIRDANAVTSAPGLAGADFAGLAPDDSLVTLQTEPDPQHASTPVTATTVVMATSGGVAATYHDGTTAGFLRSEDVGALFGSPFGPVTGAAPAIGARPALRSRDEYVDEIGPPGPATRIDLVAAYQAPSSMVSGSRTETIGPLKLNERLATDELLQVAAACVGPGLLDVNVTDGDDPTHYTFECASGTLSILEASVSGAIETYPVSVTADAGTSWVVLVVTQSPMP